MAVAGQIRIQLIDLYSSGNNYISNFSTEGTLFNNIETYFKLGFPSEYSKFPVPVLARGSSPNHPSKVTDPAIYYTYNGDITGFNNYWKSGQFATQISGYGLNPTGDLEAADVIKPFLGTHNVEYWQSGQVPTSLLRGKLDIIRLTQSDFQEIQTTQTGNSNASAWLSYDVNSGVNNKRMFAYAIEFIDKISGYDTNTEEVRLTSGIASNFVGYSGKRYQSICNNVGIVLDTTGKTCQPPEDNGLPIEVCISGGLTQAKLNEQIQSILRTLTSGLSTQGVVAVDGLDNSDVTVDPFSLQYSRYEGYLEYNDPIVGDYFQFDSYAFNYTGQYSGIYNVNPPFPQITKRWRFGTEYSSLTGLVNKINQDLYNTEYQIWHRDICVNTQLSGYFEESPLLFAEVSGSNYVKLTSQKLGGAGAYQFTLYATGRPRGIKTSQNSLKYMMPKKISLQGANTYGTWVNLDTKSSINWAHAKNTVKTLNISSGFSGAITGINSGNSNPNEVSVSGEPNRNLIYQARVSGKNLCGSTFDKEVEFYELPEGFGCTVGEEENQPNISESLSGFLGTGQSNLFDIYLLKTGIKFSNNSNFNYYRLLLEDFENADRSQSLQLAQGFMVSNISFYGYTSGNPTLSGTTCIYGADYNGQVKGLTTGIITGTVTGLPSSGTLCFTNFVLTGVPNNQFTGRVAFQHSTGFATSPFTGLLNHCVTGTGFFLEQVQGYYLNTGGCIEFQKPVSGYITGYGYLTGGTYQIIYEETIRNLTEHQLVVDSGYAILTGNIPDFEINLDSTPAFAILSGSKTGLVTSSNSGQFNVSEVILQVPTKAYSFFVSGYKSSSAVLTYNTPIQGDTVFINNFPIIYSTGTSDLPLTYFKSISELTNIINSGSGNWLVTGSNNGTLLTIKSILAGNEGNGIELNTTGGGTKPTWSNPATSGGLHYYYEVNPIVPFTGLLETGVKATGFFTGLSSGNITGRIKQLDFVRHWTGIWNIQTGQSDFKANSWTGSVGKYTNNPFSLYTYSGHPNSIPITITYRNSPLVFSQDLAKLTITGVGLNTGIVMILSGQS